MQIYIHTYIFTKSLLINYLTFIIENSTFYLLYTYVYCITDTHTSTHMHTHGNGETIKRIDELNQLQKGNHHIFSYTSFIDFL